MTIRIGKPKPKLTIGRKHPAESPFHQLVKEAIAVTEKLNPLIQVDGGRLTADALLREVMALDRTTKAQVDKLRAAIRNGSPGLDNARAAVDRISREVLRAQKFSVIPKDASKLTTRLRSYAGDKVPAELSRYSAGLLTLFAVAVAEAADRHPELFGSADSSDDLSQSLADLQARQKELFAKIQTSMTADDLHIGPLDRQGKANVGFKLTDGEVSIAPQQDAGARLVAYLLSHREKRP